MLRPAVDPDVIEARNISLRLYFQSRAAADWLVKATARQRGQNQSISDIAARQSHFEEGVARESPGHGFCRTPTCRVGSPVDWRLEMKAVG